MSSLTLAQNKFPASSVRSRSGRTAFMLSL
jgi:hypothetical protein